MQEVDEYVRRLQHLQLKNPVLVGFGIRDRESFNRACNHASGAIIGTAYIQALEHDGSVDQSTREFLKDILAEEK